MHRKLKIINRKSKISNRTAGLTLSEVIVASALLIIAIVPMLKALTTANLNTADIERKTHSLILAQAKLDEIKAKSVYHYADSYTESSEPFDAPDELYLRDVADDSDPNLREVTVSVGYDHNGDSTLADNEIEVTLATLIARRWTD